LFGQVSLDNAANAWRQLRIGQHALGCFEIETAELVFGPDDGPSRGAMNSERLRLRIQRSVACRNESCCDALKVVLMSAARVLLVEASHSFESLAQSYAGAR
jgi:hypothetical protein